MKRLFGISIVALALFGITFLPAPTTSLQAQDLFTALQSPGTQIKSVTGAAIASATTIAPVAYQTHITGTTAVVNITIPYASFAGTIILIPDAAFTTTNAGNIAIASTAVLSKALYMNYDPVAVKWYPSY